MLRVEVKNMKGIEDKENEGSSIHDKSNLPLKA
jgi:hypothetical protein